MKANNENGFTILVVDDFDEIRFTLRAWLERRHYRVVEASDGQEAIEIVKNEHPNLILMDIALPRRSGISATYKILQHFRDVPIVAITAYDSPDLREDALNAGCVDYLTKPIDTIALADLLKRLLKAQTHQKVCE